MLTFRHKYKWFEMKLFRVFFLVLMSSLCCFGQKGTTAKTISLGDALNKKSKYVVFKDVDLIAKAEFKKPISVIILKDTFNIRAKKKDSLAKKRKQPIRYQYELGFSSKLELLKRIKQNELLMSYAKRRPKLAVITKIKFMSLHQDLDVIQPEKLQTAKVKTVNKESFLQFSKEKNIPINDFTITEQESSILCWGENDRHTIEVVDIAKAKCDCPKGTSSNYLKQMKKSKLAVRQFLKL